MEAPQHAPPRLRSQVTPKTVLTVCFTTLAVAAGAWILVTAHTAFALIALSALLAVALNSPTRFLECRGLPRGVAVAVIFLLFMGAMVGIGFLLIPPVVDQVQQLSQNLPSLGERVEQLSAYQWADAHFHVGQQLRNWRGLAGGQAAQRMVEPVVTAAKGLMTLGVAVLTTFFVTLFMLAFGKPLIHRILDEARPTHRARYDRVLGKVETAIGGYLSGLSLICLANAALTTSFLALLRIPYFLPLGLLSGLSSLLPLVGNTFAGVILATVALVAGGPVKALIVVGYYLLYQQFENHVIGPIVYRRTVHLNPLVIVVSLLVFTEVAGIGGALVAVPAVAAGQVVLRELLELRRDRLGLPPEPPEGHATAEPSSRQRPSPDLFDSDAAQADT